MIDFRSLVKAGVHFGHQKTRWCPRMAPYIWGIKNNIHLIDVSKTAFLLEEAAVFLKKIAAQGKPILWIGTKKAARDAILRAGVQLKMPYVNHRWIGGTLSNFGQVKKSVTKCLHFEDILSKSEKFPHYTKKEFNTFQKVVERLEKNIGGIKKLTWPIGAVVVVDAFKEQSAIKEATKMGVPIVGLVDTNCDPTLIDYVIPTNDDAPRAINIILDYLIGAVDAGQKEAVSDQKVTKEAEGPAAKKIVKKEVPSKASRAAKKEVKAVEATAKDKGDGRKKPTEKAVKEVTSKIVDVKEDAVKKEVKVAEPREEIASKASSDNAAIDTKKKSAIKKTNEKSK